MPAITARSVKAPDWAQTLCGVLEPKSTRRQIAQRIEDGSIKPDNSLYFDLGISPTELASLSWSINVDVIDNHGKPEQRRYVTAADLNACKTVVQLFNLVYDHMGRP